MRLLDKSFLNRQSLLMDSFQLHRLEMQIMLGLSFLCIVSSYLNKTGAMRHNATSKCDIILLVHILSGIMTAVGNAIASLCVDDGITCSELGHHWHDHLDKLLAAADFVHQLTILRLLRNHDGIYPLKIGNLTAAAGKFLIAFTNYYSRHLPNTSQLRFTHAFGFMGTRMGSFFAYVAIKSLSKLDYRLSSGSGCSSAPPLWLKLEHWYSMGLATSQFHVLYRVRHLEILWLVLAPLTGYIYYHDLWDNEYRTEFLTFNVSFSILALVGCPTREHRLAALVAYYIAGGFWCPLLYRIGYSQNKSTKKKRTSLGYATYFALAFLGLSHIGVLGIYQFTSHVSSRSMSVAEIKRLAIKKDDHNEEYGGNRDKMRGIFRVY